MILFFWRKFHELLNRCTKIIFVDGEKEICNIVKDAFSAL